MSSVDVSTFGEDSEVDVVVHATRATVLLEDPVNCRSERLVVDL